MNKNVTIKALVLRLVCCLFVLTPSAAFSWSQATHAYIADRLGARAGHDDTNEMWGIVAPDMFIFTFDPALCPGWISDQTHGTYAESFMNVWNAAHTHAEEALAYGFVAHNEAWGADHPAHEACLTCGQDVGYIITKADALLNTPLDPADPQRTVGVAFASLGIGAYEGEMVAHLLTEYAIDVMLANDVDPLLGRKLERAARTRSKEFPSLLVKAFAGDYAGSCFGDSESTAAAVLRAAEEEHRHTMMFLGNAISHSKPVAAQLLAEQVVAIVPLFLGRPFPVTEDVAVEIMKGAILGSMAICDDYSAEIEATIDFVATNLKDHGVAYSLRPKGP
jgi:hypothetical protein